MDKMNNRVWIDTLQASTYDDQYERMVKLLAEGKTLVTAETGTDVKVFRDHFEWFRECVVNGLIVIELWNDPDKMVSKEFQWSSFGGLVTPAVECYYDVVDHLPEECADVMCDLGELIFEHGKERGTWEQGPWTTEQPLTEEDAALLEVAIDAPRTEVLKACTAKGVDFAPYNKRYVAGLMSQHRCAELF